MLFLVCCSPPPQFDYNMLKMVLDLANSTDTVQGVTIYTMLGAMMPLSKCDPSNPLAAKHCIVEDLFSRYS